MNNQYDILIVGGGPGGAVAAKTAAKAGLSVLLVEKRPAVGIPVRCAESISKKNLAEFIQADQKIISAEITKIRITTENGKTETIPTDGYILNRKTFDRELIWQAAEAGAEIQVHARAAEPILENDTVCGAVIEQHGKRHSVRAKIVISADGIESAFARRAGIHTTLPLAEIRTALQYGVTGIDICQTERRIHLIGKEDPIGYLWVYPKGNRSANIGVAILGAETGDGHRPADCLDRFLLEHYPEGKITERTAGGIPLSCPLKETAKAGLLIIGDAARLTNPVTGQGIYHALLSGKLAAETAVSAIQNGDTGKKALMAYDKAWRQSIIGKNTIAEKLSFQTLIQAETRPEH